MKKKLTLLFCILSCVMVMAGCSLVKQNKNYSKAKLKTATDQFITSWFAADFTGTIKSYSSQMDDTTIAEYKNYAKMQKKYQGITKKLKTVYTLNTDSATVEETLLCKNGQKIVATVSFDEKGEIAKDESGNYEFKFEEYKSIGQTMGKAGLNTAMGIGIVFFVLVFICLLITRFKWINSYQEKQNAKENQAAASQTVSAPAPVVEEDLSDDEELVAVITAAIVAATEAESADGLVVRSIIRRA